MKMRRSPRTGCRRCRGTRLHSCGDGHEPLAGEVTGVRKRLQRANGALEFEITYKSPKTKAKSGLKSLSLKGRLTCKSAKDVV